MRISASKLAVLENCQFWARPENVAPDEPSGEKADTGKRFHSLADCEVSGGAPETFPLAKEVTAQNLMTGWRKWWPEFRRDGWWRTEVAFLYQSETGTVREMERGWANGKRDRAQGEIPVIVDLLGAVAPDRAEVHDYKTGRHVGAVATNWQLLIAGLVVHRHYGVSDVTIGIIYPRARDPFIVETVSLGVLDLLEFEAELRVRMKRVPTSEPQRGDWCFRCSFKSKCPALASPVDYAGWEDVA